MVIAVISILAAVFLFVLIKQLKTSDHKDHTLQRPAQRELNDTRDENPNNVCDYCQKSSAPFKALSSAQRNDYLANLDQAIEDASYGKYGGALDAFKKIISVAPPADHYKIALQIAESFAGLCYSKTPNAILDLYDELNSTKIMLFAEQHNMRNKITQGLLLSLENIQPEVIRDPDIKNVLAFLNSHHPLIQMLIQEHNQDLANLLNNMAQKYNNQWVRVGGGYSTVKLSLEQKLTPGTQKKAGYPASADYTEHNEQTGLSGMSGPSGMSGMPGQGSPKGEPKSEHKSSNYQADYAKEAPEYAHDPDDLEIINYALKSAKKAEDETPTAPLEPANNTQEPPQTPPKDA